MKKRHKLRTELDIFFKKAIEQNIPILGICYGAQFIADYFNSSLKNRYNHVAKKHKIYFANEKNENYFVNSFHNYGIEKLSHKLFLFTFLKIKTLNALNIINIRYWV